MRKSSTMIAFPLVYKVAVICQVGGAEYSPGHQLCTFFCGFAQFYDTESPEYRHVRIKTLGKTSGYQTL